jgi:hypothetical protein
MKFAFPALLFCTGLALAAPVPEKPALPSGSAPQFVVAELRDGNFLIMVQREVPVTEERTVEVKQGNQTFLRKELVTVFKTVPEQRMLKGTAVKVYDVDGNVVAPADAAARLKEATPVLLAGDGKPVDPAYRALLNKKVLILVNSEANSPIVTLPTAVGPGLRPLPPPPPPPPPPGR